MKKKLLSTLLATSMVLSMVPASALTASAAEDAVLSSAGRRDEAQSIADYEATLIASALPSLVGNELGLPVVGPRDTIPHQASFFYKSEGNLIGVGNKSESLCYMNLYVPDENPPVNQVAGSYYLSKKDPMEHPLWSRLSTNAEGEGIGLKLSASLRYAYGSMGNLHLRPEKDGWILPVSTYTSTPSSLKRFSFYSSVSYPSHGGYQYISNVVVAYQDVTPPSVKSVSVKDNYVTLTFNEPLRRLWSDANAAMNTPVKLHTADGNVIEARVVGFNQDCTQMVIYPDMTQAYIAGNDVTITKVDFHNTSSMSDLYGCPDNDMNTLQRIPSYVTLSAPFSDYAGNSTADTDITFTLRGASPVAVEFDMTGNMITENTTDLEPENWPEKLDRESVFAGVGDSLNFTMMVKRADGDGAELFAHNTANDDQQGYLVLNVNDADGNPVQLPTTTVVNRSQQANAAATGLINFTPFVVEAGMTLSDTTGYVRPVQYVGTNGVYDVTGLPVATQDVSTINMAKKIYLDAVPPEATLDVLDLNGSADYISATVSLEDAGDPKGITAEMMDTEARFALYGESYIGQEPTPIQYQYSIDGGEWMTATLDSTAQDSGQFPLFMPQRRNSNTLRFRFPATEDLVLQDLMLDVTAADIAGSSGTTTLPLDGYAIDRCAPILSMVSSKVSYDTTQGTFTGEYAITDHTEEGLTASYQWDGGSATQATVTEGTFTVTGSENKGTTTTKTLTITVRDAEGNATVYNQDVTYDMDKAQSVYQLGDLSAPSNQPAVTVSSPDKGDKAIATTRVTVTTEEGTYVRIFSSEDALEGASLFDFDATWHQVTITSADGVDTYETVTPANFATFYGEVEIAIASAYADLTPAVGNPLVLAANEGYNNRGTIATVRYAPTTANTHRIADARLLDGAGTQVDYADTAILGTMQDYVMSFTVSNTLMADWGMSDLDFARSVVTLYDETNTPLWTSKLSNNPQQKIVLPARNYDTGLYHMDVKLVSKAGSENIFPLFDDLVIDNVTVSGAGLWGYSIATDDFGPRYTKKGTTSITEPAYSETTQITSYDDTKPLDYIGVYELVLENELGTYTGEISEYVGADGTVVLSQDDCSNIPEDVVWSQLITGASASENILQFSMDNPQKTLGSITVGADSTLTLFTKDRTFDITYLSTDSQADTKFSQTDDTRTFTLSARRLVDALTEAGVSLEENLVLYYQLGLTNGQKSQAQQFTLAYRTGAAPMSADLTFSNLVTRDVLGEDKVISVDVGLENITSTNSAVTVYHASFDEENWCYTLNPYTGPVTCYYEDFEHGNFMSGNGNLTSVIYNIGYYTTVKEMFIIVDEWGAVGYFVPYFERGYSPYGWEYMDAHGDYGSNDGPYGIYQFVAESDMLGDYLDFYETDAFPQAEDSAAVTMRVADSLGVNLNPEKSTITWNGNTADFVQDTVTPNGTGILGGGLTAEYRYQFNGDSQLYFYGDLPSADQIPADYEFESTRTDVGDQPMHIYNYTGEWQFYSSEELSDSELPDNFSLDYVSYSYYLKMANPIGIAGESFEYAPTINAVGYAGDLSPIQPTVEALPYQAALVDATQGNSIDPTDSTLYFNTYLQAINGNMDYKYTLPTDCHVETFPDITFTDAYGETQVISGLSLDASDKPTVTVSTLDENAPVTLTFTFDKPMYLAGLTRQEIVGTDDDGNPITETITLVEPEDVTGDGTTSITVTLRQNVNLSVTNGAGTTYGYFTVNTIDVEALEEEKNQNITDATPEYVDNRTELAPDTSAGNTLYTTITAKLYTENNGEKEYLVDSEGELLTYVFDPMASNYVTSYTFPAGSYFDKYGATGDTDVTVTLGDIVLKVVDDTAPSLQFTGKVGVSMQSHDADAVYNLVPATVEDDHPALPASDLTEYDDTTDFVDALGWGTYYTLTYTAVDKQDIQLYLKDGVVTEVTDFTDYASDTVPGVSLNTAQRTLSITGSATFTLVAVDTNGNTSYATFVFTMGSVPVPTVKLDTTTVPGTVRVTLNAASGMENLKITNLAAQDDGAYLDYTDNVENDVISYSFTYNGFPCTGGVLVTVDGLYAALAQIPYDAENQILYSSNYHAAVTNQDIALSLAFNQPLQAIFIPSAYEGIVTATALDNVARFVVSENTAAISGIQVTDIYGQSTMVTLEAISTIDKTAPVISSTAALLDAGVYQYTFTADEAVNFHENGEGNKTSFTRTITANGDYRFHFTDNAGNHTTYPLTVDGYPDALLHLTFSTTSAGTYNEDLAAITVGETFYVQSNQVCTVTFNNQTYQLAANTPQMLTMYGSGSVPPCIVAVNPFKTQVCHIFEHVTIPDTTPPQISILDRDYTISLPMDTAALEAALRSNVIVADNKDSAPVVTLTYAPLVTGNNVITYTATDAAGNATTAAFTLRVFGADSAVVSVNGAVVARNAILLLDSGTHSIQVTMPESFNAIEPYSLSIAAGRYTAAQMKIGATTLLDQATTNQTMNIQLDDIGYYTVLVQSQGRDTYLFTLYVQ